MAKKLIVKVIFAGNYKTMLFGNSYKSWDIQFKEFYWEWKRKNRELKLSSVEISRTPWIEFGGLKWCPEDKFQEQLNREGCQEKEPDNPNPRQYSDMFFVFDEKVYNKVKKIMSE